MALNKHSRSWCSLPAGNKNIAWQVQDTGYTPDQQLTGVGNFAVGFFSGIAFTLICFLIWMYK